MKSMLFVYGSLQDSEVRSSLWGCHVASVPATVVGWEVFQSDDGGLFARPARQQAISGLVLELDAKQLHKADQWAQIPFCKRERVTVRVADGSEQESWMYTRREGLGPYVAGNGFPSCRDPGLFAAEKLNKQLLQMEVPICDMYIMIPCVISSVYKRTLAVDDFIEIFNETTKIEYSGGINRQFSRGILDDVDLVACPLEDDEPTEGVGRQRIRIYLSTHQETGLGIITLAIPACTISPQRLLGQMSGDNLKFCRGAGPLMSLDSWLSSHGLTQMGTPRASIVLATEPSYEELCCLLSAEYDPVEGIVGHSIQRSARTNLAQYDYYKMYISETCEVEIPEIFGDNYEKRATDAILTLFVIELILFQDASLSRVQAMVHREIEKSSDARPDDALVIIEDLGSYFAKAMLFWDIRNFRYQTAQKCADDFAKAFEIDRLRENYHANRSILEQLVQIHATRVAERENKVINAILMILAVLQVLPIVYEIISSIIYGSVTMNQLLSAVATAVTCSIIWLFFLWRRNRRSRFGWNRAF